jgi:hypothetical protein
MRSLLFVLFAACGSAAPVPVANTAAPAAVALTADQQSDLEVFRAAHGQPWSPAQTPAVAASTRLFATLHLTGLSSAEVRALLGPPSEVEANGAWNYTRHNGESGDIRMLTFADDRVVAIGQVMTQ